MFDFLIRKFVVQGAQKHIDKHDPDVSIHVPKELPLPSVSTIKKMSKTVSAVNALEEKIRQFSDEQLKAKTEEFKAVYQKAIQEKRSAFKEIEAKYRGTGAHDDHQEIVIQYEKAKEDMKKARQEALDVILPEAFAVVRETGKRVIGLRHYDIQLVGGIVLHEGRIAEMATGEGKTLVATLPAYLNALTGEGVHIITVNDYLAQRDRAWMGPIFEFLGQSVGVIMHDLSPSERKEAYGCDITYGTNNEFGFDYLRDNMVSHVQEMVQREHHFAVVDEVDSILVDEARTPLIISGPAEESTGKYYTAYGIVKRLRGRRVTEDELIDAKNREEDMSIGYDYIADEKNRSISLTEAGEERAAKEFGIDNLHDMETVEYRHHILQAIKAREFFKADVDYVIRDGQVIIVDEFTGRLMPGRRWSDGLHQAVEASEGIKIERENQTLATITFQNYFRMYDKLSGMTGTAYTEAAEFQQIYNLDTVVMPPNRVLNRSNFSDCIYKTSREKYAAAVEEIEECHKRGQPVLVGTISIEKSELLSSMLKQKGVPHQVLNAKYHEMEAQIVAQAGRFEAITIATNMAGRGTDIVLGGNAEFLAKSLAEKEISDDETKQDQKDVIVAKFLNEFREKVKREHEQVINSGGLHVMGTERHESRRIDNQLRGRSGRQGDPGSSKFFISLEDDLMRLFAADRIKMMMDKLGMEDGQVIEHPLINRALEVAQKRVETFNFEIRKQLIEYDNVMNKQREAIYGLRRNILESDNVNAHIMDAIADVIDQLIDQYLFTGTDEINWDVEGLDVALNTKFGYDMVFQKDKIRDMDREEIFEMIFKDLKEIYAQKENDIGREHMRQMEKILLLNTIDGKWKDHLYAMDQLKGGVGLRGYAQRDPLVEFKREGYEMFHMMYASINQEVAELIYKIRPVMGERKSRGVFSSLPQNFIHNDFSGMSADAVAKVAPSAPAGEPEPPDPAAPRPVRRSQEKVGRNDPCPCGSGKKYKKCCGR
ncbi:MAG: preprotein translocase subunit SecA [Candidatus Omnitrophica bacterium]|nr:preprotein translocase subunit SecA [Candidatus Omnitrophota bacterium]